MKITKRQLRRIIREALAGPPQTVEEWMYWGGEFGLSAEEDNDGQTVFYLSADQPDRTKIAAEAVKAGAQVDTDNDGNDIIYTGIYGKEGHRGDVKAAEEILATRAGSYKGTALPGGKRIK
jgi:hypothetical protein